ncbi:hypothetical protein [Pseudomonas putida]|uniref:Lipoprotein n=1 Tax=Pseudomonas putida TaxID=303 RepID=A0A7V8EEK6_PSEPU|nr:hypothetical protein [Pseudomonas putida]KAF0253425.1 hypothetical protein GN299_18065 [Pseudomonas putida]
MKNLKIAVLALACVVAATGCREEKSLNEAGLSEATYEPSGVAVQPMVYPGMDNTVFKVRGKFKDPQLPQPWHQPKTWVVYMAAPGWTNGGFPIVDRLSTDAVAISKVFDFTWKNHLRDQVKVAWLQYDPNPNPRFMDDLKVVPDNFIPLFLKPAGPQVDYYIYSPSARHAAGQGVMQYDRWLKPFLRFAKKQGDDYVANNDFQRSRGFDDVNGKYWDNWARHWFIVNPEGEVVDAYFSNLGNNYIQGAERPINSLIHHLKLDSASLVIPKLVNYQYQSLYTAPYWNKVDAEVRDVLEIGGASK